MLTSGFTDLLERYASIGWVLEPDAKRVLSEAGIPVPKHLWVSEESRALAFAEETGYPLVAKAVSPDILHKSDAGAVVTGIRSEQELRRAYARLAGMQGARGVLVEETVSGLELILGAKMDEQFGPVVMVGFGGTGVEIYQDTVIRMAPLDEGQTEAMLDCLHGRQLLHGYRGKPGVHMVELIACIVRFSRLLMNLDEAVDSMDINPLMCSESGCIAADARIMLRESPNGSGEASQP